MPKNSNSKFVDELFKFLSLKGLSIDSPPLTSVPAFVIFCKEGSSILEKLKSRLLKFSLSYLFGDIDKTKKVDVEDRIKTLFKEDSKVLCRYKIENHIYNFVKLHIKKYHVFNDQKKLDFFVKAGLNTKTQRMESIINQFNFDYVDTTHSGATSGHLKRKITAATLRPIEAIKLIMYHDFLRDKRNGLTKLVESDNFYIDQFDELYYTENQQKMKKLKDQVRKLKAQVRKLKAHYNKLLRRQK